MSAIDQGEIAPKDADAAQLLHQAEQCRLAGNFQRAMALQRQVIAISPADANVHINLGVMQMGLSLYKDAAQSFYEGLRLAPEMKEAWYNLGIAVRLQGDNEAAIQCNQRVLEMDPAFIDAYDNLCDSYIALKRFDDLAACAMKVIALKPDHANGYFHLGVACFEQGNIAASRTFLERAVVLSPRSGNILSALSLVLLALGELPSGWLGYEARFLKETQPVQRLDFPFPEWGGAPDQIVLVWGEQGIADQIMFANMIDDMMVRSKKVILGCSKKLLPLFQRSFPDAQLFDLADRRAWMDMSENIQAQSAVGSLARWLRNDIEQFPKRSHFLLADPRRVLYWRARLDALGPALKVGICWRSGDMSGDRGFYCSQILQWAPVFSVPGVRFINLQYDDCAEELELTRQRLGMEVLVFPEVDLFDDIDESAALTKALDLVIAAPTTTGILAAALGVPTWQMVSGFNWQNFGTDENCWYSTLTTIPRAWDQRWEQMFDHIASKLRSLVNDHE